MPIEDLLRGASSRWRTVRATCRQWTEPGRPASWGLTWAAEHGAVRPETVVEVWAEQLGEPVRPVAVPALTTHVSCREMEQVPDVGPEPSWARVWDRGRWWVRLSPDTVLHNDGVDPDFHPPPGPGLALFFPDDVPDECAVTERGTTVRAGRSALVLEAVPRDARSPGPPCALSSGAEPGCWSHDRYVLEVDAEVGVLLAVTAWTGGRPCRGIEVEAVELDVPLPPDAFEYVPPPGVRVKEVPPRR